MIVEFCLDELKGIDYVVVSKVDTAYPIEFFSEVERSLQDGLPFDDLLEDHYYSAKLTPMYEHNGAGAQYFAGFTISDLKYNTPVMS